MEEASVRSLSALGSVSLRVSVTDRCRLRCLYCTPAEGVSRYSSTETLTYGQIVRFVRLIKERSDLTKVHITGGEPLERSGIVEFVGMLAGLSPPNLAMTTNGQRLREFAHRLRDAGLKQVNISLDTLAPARFREITGGGELARTLEGIDSAVRAGFDRVKLNTTVLRGINDREAVRIAQFGVDLGVPVRFIELMPIGPAAKRHHELFVPSNEVLSRLRERFALRPLPYISGSSTREYQATDAAGNVGVIGVIAALTQPFCASCRRLRLTAGGELIGCIAASGGANILPLLRTAGPLAEEAVLATVAKVMTQKRTGGGFCPDRCMVKTGG